MNVCGPILSRTGYPGLAINRTWQEFVSVVGDDSLIHSSGKAHHVGSLCLLTTNAGGEFLRLNVHLMDGAYIDASTYMHNTRMTVYSSFEIET